MATAKIQPVDKIKRIDIGQRGENDAREIRMDISAWQEKYPGAGFHILFRRPGEELIYPVVTETEGDTLTWLVSNTDTAVSGLGHCEIRAVDAAGLVRKSRAVPVVVNPSLVAPADVPEPMEEWVNTVLTETEAAVEAAEDAAQRAEASADGNTRQMGILHVEVDGLRRRQETVEAETAETAEHLTRQMDAKADAEDLAELAAESETEDGKIRKTLASRYAGKKVSIIGDSVSTFAGYLPDGYEPLYPASAARYGVDAVTDTWWQRVIDATGAKLEVNASWSGSRATTYSIPGLYPRVSAIGDPDLVIVALGTNDSWASIDLGEYDYTTAYASLSESAFRPAYIKGLKAIQALHPDAEIVCLILDMGDTYRDSIVAIAGRLGVQWIECRDYQRATGDSIHPNAAGMRQIASRVLYPTDPSLTQSHMPADANETGWAIKNAALKASTDLRQAEGRVTSDIRSTETRVMGYAGSRAAAALQSAKDYADSQDAVTLQSAKDYADSQDAVTLQSAKDYADALAAGKAALIESEASGRIATFSDGAAGMPMEVTVALDPIQAGSGDPAPDNVRAINGYSAVKIDVAGKNLFSLANKEVNGVTFTIESDGTYSIFGTATSSVSFYLRRPAYGDNALNFPCVLSIENFNWEASAGGLYATDAVANERIISGRKTDGVVECNNGIAAIWFYISAGETVNVSHARLMIRKAGTDSEFEPYIGSIKTITFPTPPGTVYGGTLTVNRDGTGKLVVDRQVIDLGSLSPTYSANRNWYFSGALSALARIPATDDENPNIVAEQYISYAYNDLAGNADLIGISYNTANRLVIRTGSQESLPTGKIVYYLATPITYDLTAEQVGQLTSVYGLNNVWSAGQVEVTYAADTKLYIDGKIASLQATILENISNA